MTNNRHSPEQPSESDVDDLRSQTLQDYRKVVEMSLKQGQRSLPKTSVDPLRQKEAGNVSLEKDGKALGLVYEFNGIRMIEKRGNRKINALGANDYLQLFSYKYEAYRDDIELIKKYLRINEHTVEFQNYYFNSKGVMVVVGHNALEAQRITPEGMMPIVAQHTLIDWATFKNVLTKSGKKRSSFYDDAVKRLNATLGAR